MEKLRLIQCGVGGFGKSWLAEVTSQSPDFELVAIVDIAPENLAEAGGKASAARQFRTLGEALENVSAEAVLTVTPPAVHVQHARLAHGRGLHLMTEKPLADMIEHAQEMVRLFHENGRQLMVSQNYRFNPAMQQARQLIAEKTAGELAHGHLDFYLPADFTGTFRETMEFPLLVDMAIHHLDLIRFITGRNIVKVTAHSFRPPWSWFRHDPGLKMLLELEGGAAFSYSGDWSALGRCTSWNGDWRLQCAEGSVHVENDAITVHRCERWAKNPTAGKVELDEMPRTPREATLHAFAESIRNGQSGELSGESNLWSFGAVIAGVQSARAGGIPVNVAELIGQA